jgi:predicted negative regulator of RcsB-dependent stress response
MTSSPRHHQRAFSTAEALIVIVILAVVSLVGFFVYDRARQNDTAKTPTAAEQAAGTNTPASPEVTETSDLDSAQQALDGTNLDAGTTDLKQLDTELSAF